jgi:hypothetical protein
MYQLNFNSDQRIQIACESKFKFLIKKSRLCEVIFCFYFITCIRFQNKELRYGFSIHLTFNVFQPSDATYP